MVALTELQGYMIDAVHAECARYRASRKGECDDWCPVHAACRALPVDSNGKLSAFVSAYNGWRRTQYWDEDPSHWECIEDEEDEDADEEN